MGKVNPAYFGEISLLETPGMVAGTRSEDSNSETPVKFNRLTTVEELRLAEDTH